ncbi:hypothetical protein V3851_12845 [Paenibacillus sp. M1]|uniref:Uncharacterized protein n=1 Tax=Paenibacillus haidiansis TaxID=1574488 RepID=A0ABU7VTZ8_9BACL
MLYFVLLVTAVICWIEIPSFFRQKQWKEMTIFALVLLMGIALAIAHKLQLPLSNLTLAAENAVKPLTKAIFGIP